MAAMSIFFIFIIASNARLAAARSGSVVASRSARGVICPDRPYTDPECHMRVALLRSIASTVDSGEESIPNDGAEMRGRSSVGEPVELGVIHRTFP